jgi:hypothetical protein
METGAFLGGLDGPIDQLDLVHTSTYQVHARVNTRHTSTYQYMHVMEYLGSDEVPNHEGQREHQYLHSIICHLGILLAINVKVVEVD